MRRALWERETHTLVFPTAPLHGWFSVHRNRELRRLPLVNVVSPTKNLMNFSVA